jgi:hypothetical protein
VALGIGGCFLSFPLVTEHASDPLDISKCPDNCLGEGNNRTVRTELLPSHPETLTPNVTAFGDRNFLEVTRLNEVTEVGL